MLRKIVLFLVIFCLGGMLFKSFYRGYVEAYAQEVNIPLGNELSANFETKLNAKYKVVIALKPSDGLKKTNRLINGGDAYETSANLGRYILEGLKLKIDGITDPDIKFKETFSIFGGAPAYENTALKWEPHSSYLLANFQGKAGSQYKITITQELINGSQSKPSVPAYIMVRKANDWSNSLIVTIVFIAFTILIVTAILKSICFLFKLAGRIFIRLQTHHSSGTPNGAP